MTTSTSPTQPEQPWDDPFRMAFIRGIVAAMSGDQAGIDRATKDIHAVTAPYIE